MTTEVSQVLEEAADVDSLSFYGLAHWLAEVGKLLERADHAAVSKAPRPDDQAVAERKAELLEAQRSLRRAMGASLEPQPSLTKRERPLAEAFLQEQITKLTATTQSNQRAAQGVERLRKLLEGVRCAPPATDSREVRDCEALIKQLDAERKEAFRRRYEECRKGRETCGEKLQKALRASRALHQSQERAGPGAVPAGWSAIAKKQAPPPATRQLQNAARGAAAVAVERKETAPKRSTGWGSAVVSFAQRLQAEMTARVREETVQHDESSVAADHSSGGGAVAADGFQAPTAGKAAKPRPALGRTDISALANAKRWGPVAKAAETAEEEEEDEDGFWVMTQSASSSVPEAHAEEPAQQHAAASPAREQRQGNTASAKKKGKGKKKKGGHQGADEDDDEGLAEPAPASSAASSSSSSAWLAGVETALAGSVVQELIQREAWGLLTPAEAEKKLAVLSQRLPLTTPLGLVLPMEWKDFAALEVDGGPQRTSRRGTPPWLRRLRKTVPWLLPHYITILFMLSLLQSLSHFGLLALVGALQAALILAPPEALHVRTPVRLLLLQGTHLLVWVFFVRALWLMHLLVKMFLALLVVGHAYLLAEAGTS